MSGKKRCFESIRALQKLDPIVLRSVLCKFPKYLRAQGIDLSERSEDEPLDYEAIKDALMDGDMPPEQLFHWCSVQRVKWHCRK